MADRTERLLELSRALFTETSLERVLQRVTNLALDIVGAKYAALGVLGPDGHTIETFTTAGVSDELRARLGATPRGHGILGLVIRENRVIRLPDLTRHPASYGFPPHHPPMHSFLGVPVVGRDGVFGNLYLTEKIGASEFSDEDERMTMLLASQAAAAVENARLHQQSAVLLTEVQRLMRSREQFFAMVNHELRNSMASIHGWAQMATRPLKAASAEEAIREVLEASTLASSLINDLLDLSRLDEQRLKPVMAWVSPSGLAQRIVNRIRPMALDSGATIVEAVPPDLPAVNTDASRVLQILHNLLANAVAHTGRGRTITLSAAMNHDTVTFLVDDEGEGVPADAVERIFDLYESRRDGPGIGLGLPLSRRLARLLGGDLVAIPRNRTPHGGGRFALTLPVSGKDA
jgi:signal transduction histidine kinase